ncbi:MAG: inositol monophosphatase family protein [Gemmatimonadaceae bacterium]
MQLARRLNTAEDTGHPRNLRGGGLSSQREESVDPSADSALAAHLLDACVRAARIGAGYIRSRTSDLHVIDWQSKSRSDFVSEVDTATETRIADSLLADVPDARVLGEELSPADTPTTDSEIVFIVDPLDGTTNFLHGFPAYAVSIAALAGGHSVAGVVLQVPHDVLFSATRGGGAYRDGAPIRVSTISEPSRALIGTGFPFKTADELARYLPPFSRIAAQTAGVRRAGAAALDLADVACGRFEAFWELMLAPWDMAAGLLLVREAGGRVTDLQGVELKPSRSGIVASNGMMHEWMMHQLRD